MSEWAYVYILASKGCRLYIGVTNNLEARIWQHKNKSHPNSFTAKYNIDRLVYFERFVLYTSAIARENALKDWSRQRKIALIVANNPTWRDLSLEWGTPTEPFDEAKLRPPVTFGDHEPGAVMRAEYGDSEAALQNGGFEEEGSR